MNKKGILITVIIAILCLAIGFGGSYMLLKDNKCNTKECEEKKSNKQEESDNKKEETPIDTTDYEQLLDKINKMSTLEYLNKNFSVNDLSNLEMLNFALNFIDERYDKEFSIDKINEVTKKYFGKEVTGEDVPCEECVDVKLFLYDKDKKVFKYNDEHGGHGISGIHKPNIINRIVQIKNDGNKYTVLVKKAFCVMRGHTGYCTAYHKSYDDALDGNNTLFDIKLEENEALDEAIEYYHPEAEFNKISNDTLNTYTYTFEKNDNNEFIFSSYTFK